MIVVHQNDQHVIRTNDLIYLEEKFQDIFIQGLLFGKDLYSLNEIQKMEIKLKGKKKQGNASQMFNIPWTRQIYPIHVYQMITSFSSVAFDSVGSFLVRAQFSLC